MPNTAAQTEAIRTYRKMVREKSKALHYNYGKWNRAVKDRLMGNDNNLFEAKEYVLTRFGDCTPRKLENALKYNGPTGSESRDVLVEGRIIKYLEEMADACKAISLECETQLAEIDAMEAVGEDEGEVMYYEMELVARSGGKSGDETSVKKLPLPEARHQLLKRSVEAMDSYFKAVKNLRGGTVINIDNRTSVSDLSMDDLDRQIREMEKMNNIKDGLSSEQS